MSRAALIVGIDEYLDQNVNNLSGCVNDATAINKLLARNADGSRNFETKLLVSSLGSSSVSAQLIRKELNWLFNSADLDAALFYFAGHGCLLGQQGHICTADAQNGLPGIALDYVLGLANQSRARHRIIILDSCHSGSIRQLVVANGNAPLNDGTAILAACRDDQFAAENGGRGLFSSLVCDALDGGAADVRGQVTIASIYAYVDEILSSWEQRPLFLASLPSFISLRKSSQAIDDEKLRQLPSLFIHPDIEFALDPSFEYTSDNADPRNVEIFRTLQQMRAARLVVPVGVEHMYDAAIQSRTCRLTPLGKFYWHQADRGRI